MSLNEVRVDGSKIAGGIFFLNKKFMPEPFTEKENCLRQKDKKYLMKLKLDFHHYN